MTNNPYVRSVLAQATLELTHPLIRKSLLEDSTFREEYGLTTDGVISFGGPEVSVQCSNLFDAARKILSGTSTEEVTDTKGQRWELKNIREKGELPILSFSRGRQSFHLPNLTAFSPDRDTRLRFLDKAASDVNLPDSSSNLWRNIFAERALENEEVNAFNSEFLDTPVGKARSISGNGPISIPSLVPSSRRYFEMLVGTYDGSPSIRSYASGIGRILFNQLSMWRPYDGFLFSLFLSSHSSMTAEINVDQLSSEDLVRAFDFLDKHGDRISQLGAIEVGLRVLPSRPEIEQTLIRLIKQIRDDDVDGQRSNFKLLSALFCLVDGELSRIRLLSAEPPFYRKLAALSQAALIHRQLVNSTVDIDHFSKWAFSNHGWQWYLQSLADMRLEPRWDPEFVVASQMKAEFFGRIIISAKTYEQNIIGSEIYDLVLAYKTGSLQSLIDPFSSYLPGPLEGTEGKQDGLPPEVAATIEVRLGAKEIEPSSFIALVNSALIFHIGANHAELATTALKRANHHLPNIEDKSQLLAIFNGLANVAAVARKPALTDELRILVRRYRRDAQYALSIEEVIRICLVAAASRADLNDWTEFVGDWLTELAFSDLKDDEGRVLYSHLNGFCHIVPELWVSCGRADAALMAFNARLS